MTETSLVSLLETVWSHIQRGASDRKHPARHPVLATQSPSGPEARVLVLRQASRAAGTIEFHTDAASPKVAQLQSDPRVALHFWIPKARLQIRAKALAAVMPGDAELFARLPPEAQANYRGAVPGSKLPAATSDDGARFTRLICTVAEIAALLLHDPHQRARFAADQNWKGHWIAP